MMTLSGPADAWSHQIIPGMYLTINAFDVTYNVRSSRTEWIPSSRTEWIPSCHPVHSKAHQAPTEQPADQAEGCQSPCHVFLGIANVGIESGRGSDNHAE